MMTRALRFLVGAALLFLGRQLYWLFVAGIGFVVAMDVAPQLVPIDPEATVLILIIALVAGLIGALLAVFLQKLGIAVGGSLAAGYAAWALLQQAGLEMALLTWILVLVAGVIGAILTLVLFDWALIGLSSLSGAWIITQELGLADQVIMGLVFLVLLVIGIATQASLMGRTETAAD